MKKQDFLIEKEYIWTNMIILDSLEGINNDNPKFISFEAISNIPLIEYPTLSEEQNKTIFTMAKEVLTSSRNENNFNEVSITYRMDMDKEEPFAFKKIYGNENNVNFMSDLDTQSIIQNTKGLYIVSLHNHPTGGYFSIKDLLAFSVNNNIVVMEILNNKGDAAFLYRPKEIDVKNIIPFLISKYAPDFRERMNSSKEKDIISLLTIKEKENIVKEALQIFKNKDIIISGFLNKDTVKDFVFPENSIEDVKTDI